MKIFKYCFEFIIIISLFCIFKIIGLNNASALGGILAKFIGPLFRSKKNILLNVKKALPKLEEKNIDSRIAKTFQLDEIDLEKKK